MYDKIHYKKKKTRLTRPSNMKALTIKKKKKKDYLHVPSCKWIPSRSFWPSLHSSGYGQLFIRLSQRSYCNWSLYPYVWSLFKIFRGILPISPRQPAPLPLHPALTLRHSLFQLPLGFLHWRHFHLLSKIVGSPELGPGLSSLTTLRVLLSPSSPQP